VSSASNSVVKEISRPESVLLLNLKTISESLPKVVMFELLD
jgi:hypothetical protein